MLTPWQRKKLRQAIRERASLVVEMFDRGLTKAQAKRKTQLERTIDRLEAIEMRPVFARMRRLIAASKRAAAETARLRAELGV